MGMSGIASEIQNRMRDDGIDPSQTIVPGAEDDGRFGEAQPGAEPAQGAPVPGSDGGTPTPPPEPVPSAGTQNTDTGSGQDPGPIPYARFKEVNDRYAALRDFEQLAEYGYTPDHLGRLASFEASYLQDPTGTVAAMVDDLDLPPESKARLIEELRGSSSGDDTGRGAATGDGAETSTLSPEDRELLQWAKSERERVTAERTQAESDKRLDTVVNAWKASDTKDKIESPPDHRLLAFVSAAAARGGFRTLEELAAAARADWLEERDRLLGGAVQHGRREGNPPPALPGSGALPAPEVRPRTLSEASKLARAAMERGELPGLGG